MFSKQYFLACFFFNTFIYFFRPVTPLPATVPYRGQTPLDPIDLGIPEAILKEITGSAPRAGERMPSMHKN